jgi:hypothetical protein
MQNITNLAAAVQSTSTYFAMAGDQRKRRSFDFMTAASSLNMIQGFGSCHRIPF